MGVALQKPRGQPNEADALPVPYDEEHAAFIDAVLQDDLAGFFSETVLTQDRENEAEELLTVLDDSAIPAHYQDPADQRTQGQVVAFDMMDRDRSNEILNVVTEALPDTYVEEAVTFTADPSVLEDEEDSRTARDIAHIDWDDVSKHADLPEKAFGHLKDRYTGPRHTLARLVMATEGSIGEVVPPRPGGYGTLGFLPAENGKEITYPDGVEYAVDDGVYMKKKKRAYSFANSLRDFMDTGRVEFCIERVPDDKATEDSFTPPLFADGNVEEEDVMSIYGPFEDELTLPEESDRDLVFIATGTGVAPIRSLVRGTFQRGLDEYEGEKRDVLLILGGEDSDTLPYHEANNIPYRETFPAWDEHLDNFHYVPTMSREHMFGDYDGENDYVQDVLPKYMSDDIIETAEPVSARNVEIEPANTELYACGFDMKKRLGDRVDELDFYSVDIEEF